MSFISLCFYICCCVLEQKVEARLKKLLHKASDVAGVEQESLVVVLERRMLSKSGVILVKISAKLIPERHARLWPSNFSTLPSECHTL